MSKLTNQGGVSSWLAVASRALSLAVVALGVAVSAPAPAAFARDAEGVKISRPSFLRNLVSADKIEKTAALQYSALTDQAASKGTLLKESDPQVQRLRRIADELLPFTAKFNKRADKWAWDINVIDSPQINAFCMPGGKIAFFSGILTKLQLSDDEVAMVMGHEIAHALREHARERAAKSTLSNVGALAVGVLVGGNAGELARMGGGLMTLKFGRDDESEADLIGMELAARAGFNPESGVSLWTKMSAQSKGAPPQWLSTHPSGKTRIKEIRRNLPDVMPLYERAKAERRGG